MTDQHSVVTLDYGKVHFGVQKSVRYHTSRERWFQGIANGISFLTILLGSSSVFVVLDSQPKWFVTIAMSVVVIGAAVNMAFRIAENAALHRGLAKEFSRLDRQMIMCSDTSQESANKFQTTRLEIESREPPALYVLNILKHNELCLAIGKKEEIYDVDFLQRLASGFVDLWPHKIPHSPIGKSTT